jgi:uncharacterized protein YbaR (Trm112 family)
LSLIDPGLAAVLVCPVDKGALDEDEPGGRLVCQVCGRGYPVRDGIPIMLPDEAEEATND